MATLGIRFENCTIYINQKAGEHDKMIIAAVIQCELFPLVSNEYTGEKAVCTWCVEVHLYKSATPYERDNCARMFSRITSAGSIKQPSQKTLLSFRDEDYYPTVC